MPETLIAALVQTPFVLVMVYLIQRFLAHLNERDAARLLELTHAVDRLSMLVIRAAVEHDEPRHH